MTGSQDHQSAPGGAVTGTFVQEHLDFSLCLLMTRGDAQSAAESLARQLDMNPVIDPNTAASNANGVRVLWFGTKRWLIHAPMVRWRLDDIPACVVTDLSDSRRLATLSGARAAASLAKVCPLDLQAEVCAPGHCALTQFNQFSVLLHFNAQSSYDLYVERSYGEELFSVLACQ